jgi:hypothetical protein
VFHARYFISNERFANFRGGLEASDRAVLAKAIVDHLHLCNWTVQPGTAPPGVVAVVMSFYLSRSSNALPCSDKRLPKNRVKIEVVVDGTGRFVVTTYADGEMVRLPVVKNEPAPPVASIQKTKRR